MNDNNLDFRAEGNFDLEAWARSELRSRRLRGSFLSDAMFGEGAWEILLELASNGLNDLTHAVIDLCAHSRLPLSTTLRWISYLEREGLVRRENANDEAQSKIGLTDKGQSALENYVRAARGQSVFNGWA